MKQFLPYSIQDSISIKRFFLIAIFLLAFFSVKGQNALVGSGFSSGWGGGGCPTGSANFKFLASNAGGTFGITTTANGTGDQFFRFGVDWSGTTAQLTKTIGSDEVVVPNTTYSLNTNCTTNGAMKINVPNTSYNYVFKTLNAGTNPTGTFVFFEVQGAVRTVSTVMQSPLVGSVNECHKTTVTATLDGELSVGQKVYMRYTKDGYATSAVVPLAGSGTRYTGTIPSAFNSAGATVSYYVFTSGTATPPAADADLYTINLNNNGGLNYSYTAEAGGATTAILDPNFEQALINLGLDCGIDGQVFTSNISDVTILDIRDKNITSLVGIEDFTSLEELYCNNESVGDGNDNAITTLDVSGFPNLIRLYCQNNQIIDLNIAGLTKLEALDTSNNPFIATTLDVHLNPNLYYLLCQNNGLTDLNISGLTNLETLIVWDNSLSAIDLSANSKISYLDCDENLFTSLDVSNLVNLNQFYCSGNQLTNLDVRGLTNLANFQCTSNPSLSCILVDDVADATLKSVTVDPDAGGVFFWIKDAAATYSYCNCDLTTTWNGISWNNGAPTTGTYAAIIAGDYNQSVNINACSLTVTSNAIVSIPSGYNVTLNAPIIVTSGSSFALSNTANLIQTNKNSVNSGTINVNRDSNLLQRKDYTLWSSPVAGQKLAAFSPLTSLDPNRFYIYNSASNEYTNTAPAVLNPTTTNFSPGAGYLIRMPNENPAILGTSSEYYLGNASITYNGVFTGIPNNGDVPVALSTAGAGAYNLVGNPYPSTINLFTLQSNNASVIGNTFYMWRKTNGLGTAYCSYIPTTASTGTYVSNANTQSPATFVGDIQAGQGFFVSALTTGPLVFKNGQRVTTASSFFKTKQVAASTKVWLNATNVAGDFSQMAVTYFDGATLGVDAFDGKYINDSAFALTSNVNNGEYTIQGRPAFDVTDVVALNFKTELAGEYTIAIDHSEGVFASGQDIYLVDNKTGTETNLTTSSYNFTATAGVDNTRFSMKYQKTLKVDDAIFNENSVRVYAKNGSLYISSGEMAISTIQVYDVQGKLIAERKNVKATTAILENLKVNNQVLLVKVSGENNQVVTKKVAN